MFLNLLAISADEHRLIFVELILEVADAVKACRSNAQPFDLNRRAEMSSLRRAGMVRTLNAPALSQLMLFCHCGGSSLPGVFSMRA